jgi:hypothetical protein
VVPFYFCVLYVWDDNAFYDFTNVARGKTDFFTQGNDHIIPYMGKFLCGHQKKSWFLIGYKKFNFLSGHCIHFSLIDHCRVKVEEERSLLPLTTFLRSHEIQTIQHILVTCVFSRQIWFHVLSLVGLQQYTPNDGNF